MTWNTTPIVLPINPSDIKSGCFHIRREVDGILSHVADLAEPPGDEEFDEQTNIAVIHDCVTQLLRSVHMLENYAEQINDELLKAENPGRGVAP